MRNKPMLATAMLAAAMGGMGAAFGNAAESVKEFTIKADRYMPPPEKKAGGDTRAKFRPRAGGNQRQRRQDRRRLHAAGCKKAFSA